MKNAVVIQHLAFEDLGNLSDSLFKYDYNVTYLEAGIDNLADIQPLDPDLLIILGGPIGVNDEKTYSFITDELRLIEQRLRADVPTLGICLGAQLMAKALGSKVYPGHEKEMGWSALELTEEGMNSPLAHLAPNLTKVLHWHGETFDLPINSTHLASTPICQNQAFSWGKYGLALQFHPEAKVRDMERWFIGHICEITATPGVEVPKLREDTALYGLTLQVQAAKCWDSYLTKCEDSYQEKALKERNKPSGKIHFVEL